jgi:hypothetical protein
VVGNKVIGFTSLVEFSEFVHRQSLDTLIFFGPGYLEDEDVEIVRHRIARHFRPARYLDIGNRQQLTGQGEMGISELTMNVLYLRSFVPVESASA